MFNNFTGALLFSIGFAGWVYSKTYRSTGGNTKYALIVAVSSALVALLFLTYLLGAIS